MMQIQQSQHRARIVASIAATLISLACGSNYVYSAWAPQFAERLKLSSTQSNLIGLAGNLGMYTAGVPVGMFVDHRGPRPAVLIGAILLAIGYFPLHQAYDSASGSVATLCFFSYLSGLGGCTAFSAAVKTSALNWPSHRGTATAFPLAAFGLSAFFFSLVGSIIFPGNPSGFLMLLACGTSGITFVGFFFLKVHTSTSSSYEAVPGSDGAPALGNRSSSDEPKVYRSSRAYVEPGMFTNFNPNASSGTSTPTTTNPQDSPAPTVVPGSPCEPESGRVVPDENPQDLEANETSSLMSGRSSLSGNRDFGNNIDKDRSHQVDIRGMKLLRSLDFWQLFLIMAILAGVGLMTINNIGNDAKALWKHYDPSVSDEFLIKRQQLHVSILSVGSFLGRLLSGVGSDFLVKKLHASRVWCVVFSSLTFLFAQMCALGIDNPHHLSFVSGLSGIAYGCLFGVYPSIVTETFGINGLSQNWGFMTLSPVISSNIFNIFYGKIYDKHSVVQPGGERVCLEGLNCYRTAYVVTWGSCIAGLAVTLLVIRHQRLQHLHDNDKGDEED